MSHPNQRHKYLQLPFIQSHVLVHVSLVSRMLRGNNILGKPLVVFVWTSLRLVCTATASGQYSPVRPSCSISKRLLIIFILLVLEKINK